METSGFGVAAALRLAGISYPQLDYWAKTGLVQPSIQQAAGRGTRRVYSFDDLVALRVVAQLLSTGISLPKVRKATAYLKQHSERPLSHLALISDGERILALTDDPAKMVEATAHGQVVVALDVAPIRRHLEQGVSEISAPRKLPLRFRGRTYEVMLTPDLEAGGFTITVPDLPGCISEADTIAEARRMAKDAIGGWLEVSSGATSRRRRRAAQ
jgi:predicted RNase H-like HicB family nuclease/DNA-binding transcriptional MerR regulator